MNDTVIKFWKCQRQHLPVYQSTNLWYMDLNFSHDLKLIPELPGPTGHAVLFRNRPWPRGPKEVATGKKALRFQVSVQHCLGPHGCHKHRYKHLPETVDPMAIDHLGNFVFFQRFDALFGTLLNPCMIRWFWWWIIFQHIYTSWNLRIIGLRKISGLSTPLLLFCNWSTRLF